MQFAAHGPVSGTIRGDLAYNDTLCVGAQDLDNVLEKVRSGTPLDDILKPAQPVASHVLDDFSDGEDADISDGPPSGHKPDSSEVRHACFLLLPPLSAHSLTSQLCQACVCNRLAWLYCR